MPTQKILVTGATGFVGTTLCKKLIKSEHFLLPISRQAINKPGWYQVEHIDSQTNWLHLLDGVSQIVHLAALVHQMGEQGPETERSYQEVNHLATIKLARDGVKAGVKRFIYLSSIKVNGEETEGKAFSEDDVPMPDDAYARSKRDAEAALILLGEETGLDVVILRPPLIYGAEAKGNFFKMVEWIQKGYPIPFSGVQNNRRSLIFVENLVDIILSCIGNNEPINQVFVVSDGQDVSTGKLIELLHKNLDGKGLLIGLPPFILKMLFGLVGRSTLSRRLLGSLEIDNRKIRKYLNWNPKFTLEQGLYITAEKMKSGQGKLNKPLCGKSATF